MKNGDKLPVTIQGIHVADAVVEAVEADRVTLLIPGTRAVVGVRVSLTDDNTTEPEKETIVDGVVTPDNSSTATEATTATETAQPEPPAPTQTAEPAQQQAAEQSQQEAAVQTGTESASE